MMHTVSILGTDYSISTVITAVIVAFFVALVVIGGLQRIASVTSIVVPFMAIAYIVVCLCILIYNIKEIPAAVVMVVQSAFGAKAVAGGAFGAMILAMQKDLKVFRLLQLHLRTVFLGSSRKQRVTLIDSRREK